MDIAALEQRDDVGIPVTADLAALPNPGERRLEPEPWSGAPPLDDADIPLLPPLDAEGRLTGRRSSLAFLHAARTSSD